MQQLGTWEVTYRTLSVQLLPTFKAMVRKIQELESLGGWRKSRERVLKLRENVLGRKKEAVSAKCNREITRVTCDQRGVGLGEATSPLKQV